MHVSWHRNNQSNRQFVEEKRKHYFLLNCQFEIEHQRVILFHS